MHPPVARFAILGAVFGSISLPIWAALTHSFSVGGAFAAGFCGGLAGGTVYGLTRRVIRAR